MTLPSRPRLRFVREGAAASLLLAAALIAGPLPRASLEASPPGLPLYLEVSINGVSTGLIANFILLPDGRMAAAASELAETGIDPRSPGDPNKIVVLDELPDVAYRYDEASQSIDITADDAARELRRYDAAAGAGPKVDKAGYGSVINYGFFASGGTGEGYAWNDPSFNGASLSIDHRLYSPLGTLADGLILGSTVGNGEPALRLDTTWTTVMPSRMANASLGDVISGGPSWSRPIRLGGVQLRRNFGVRPDLVTMPLPAVKGSAAVPSTVDVYVNNMKTYSQDVGAGPFFISNIPVIAGNGEARVVVRDSTGRESESTTPFATSQDLLAPGLFDYSVEAGFGRRDFGAESFNYDDAPLASASLRYGLTPWLTGEAHGEFGAGVMLAGLGGVSMLGRYGSFEGAVSASLYDGETGLQISALYEAQIPSAVGPIGLSLSSLRAFGSYRDLAYAVSLDNGLSQTEIDNLAPNRAQDRMGLSFALPGAEGSLGANLLHIEDAGGGHSFFASANYSRTLWDNASLSVSGYLSFDGGNDAGISISLSKPLGGLGYGSLSGGATRQGYSASASLSSPQGSATGSLGWRAQAQLGDNAAVQAQANYRAAAADLELYASLGGGSNSVSAFANGAVVASDGGVFFSRSIEDAFAIVDAGAPGVAVSLENAPVGKTGRSGKILVPGLRAYEENHIAIDPQDLPLDAEYGTADRIVTPPLASGVSVDFGVRKDLNPAVVTFLDAAGKPIPAGAKGTVSASGESFTVGFDGQAWIKRLASSNEVTIATEAGECQARFAYSPGNGTQTLIEGVICK